MTARLITHCHGARPAIVASNAPTAMKRVGMRGDVLRRSNRHARHPVNALLNYGYAVLESQVRIAIAEVGLDPTLGHLHVCQPGRQALVYDLMEPCRPLVDREVLAFVRLQTFTPRDFVIDARGVCRLHPELARRVVALGITGADALTEVMRLTEVLEYC